MVATIQISDEVKAFLDKARLINRETYNDIIEFMIEDHLELNEKTRGEIERRIKDVDGGNLISNDEAMIRLGL